MTHSSHSARERIIERLAPETGAADWDDIANALRAVLNVHKPFDWSFGYGPVTSCEGCVGRGVSEDDSAYPCPTVTAITNALGQEADQ